MMMNQSTSPIMIIIYDPVSSRDLLLILARFLAPRQFLRYILKLIGVVPPGKRRGERLPGGMKSCSALFIIRFSFLGSLCLGRFSFSFAALSVPAPAAAAAAPAVGSREGKRLGDMAPLPIPIIFLLPVSFCCRPLYLFLGDLFKSYLHPFGGFHSPGSRRLQQAKRGAHYTHIHEAYI